MTILITRQNIPYFQAIVPKIKFFDASKNTVTATVQAKTFNKIYAQIKADGYNPFSVMNWA